MGRSLVLNATYEPLSVVSDRRAVVLVLSDKADVLHESGDAMHSEHLSVPVPSVVRLRSFVRVPFQRRAAISRRGVFLRDDGTCQYCGSRAESIDHVIPRSRGGEHVWENVVAVCRRCNTAKRDRYLHETSMQLRRRPDAPRHLSWVSVAVGRVPELWEPYLGDAAIPRVTTTPSGEPVALDAIELVRVRLPLRRPLRSAHGVEQVREVVLVHVIDPDGAEGWGECSALEAPTYTAEYTDGAWAVLRDVLAPAALGTGGPGGHVVGHPFASAALADARLDLRLRRGGRALAGSYGADLVAGLAWTAVLGIDDAPAVGQRADEAREAGASALKVKVRPSAGRDDRARAGALQAGLPVAIDANGSFRGHEDEVVDLAEQLAAQGVDPDEGRVYVEQPLPADDLVGSAALAGKLAVPVALDESVTRSGDVATAWALGAAALVNVKPARAGGVIAALGFLDPRATPVGPKAFLGGMVETGIGRATALGVGVALGLDHTDLGPSSWYFDDDLTEPIELRADGRMHAPDGPGIGVAPRPERLAEVTVDRLLLRP